MAHLREEHILRLVGPLSRLARRGHGHITAPFQGDEYVGNQLPNDNQPDEIKGRKTIRSLQPDSRYDNYEGMDTEE